jgi:hypothetical protein
MTNPICHPGRRGRGAAQPRRCGLGPLIAARERGDGRRGQRRARAHLADDADDAVGRGVAGGGEVWTLRVRVWCSGVLGFWRGGEFADNEEGLADRGCERTDIGHGPSAQDPLLFVFFITFCYFSWRFFFCFLLIFWHFFFPPDFYGFAERFLKF